MKPHKVSAHSDNCYFHFFYRWFDRVEILWGFTKPFFKQFQLCLLKNKKVLFLKKYFLGRNQYQNKKALFTDPIFSEGFDLYISKNICLWRNPTCNAMVLKSFWSYIETKSLCDFARCFISFHGRKDIWYVVMLLKPNLQ